MLKKLSIIVFVCTTGMLLLSGCASSSNSVRYGNNIKSTEKEKSSTRFTSANDDNLANNSNSSKLDTSSNFTSEPQYDDKDDIPEQDSSIDISSIVQRYSSEDSNTDISADYSTLKEKMLMEIIKYLNTPYKYGGTTSDGIDCSAFTQAIYAKTFSLSILRTARDQYTEGEKISSIRDLKFGDLVFFNTRRRVKPGHVGIYIGDGLFAQSSSKHGVIVSSIEQSYYLRRFMGGRRLENLFGSSNVSANRQ